MLLAGRFSFYLGGSVGLIIDLTIGLAISIVEFIAREVAVGLFE